MQAWVSDGCQEPSAAVMCVGGGSHLLVYLLCGLSIAEGHGSQVFQDGHFHGAVAPVQERHQRARMHRPVHDLGPDTWKQMEKERMRSKNGFTASLHDTFIKSNI